jgi:hypothetical protein
MAEAGNQAGVDQESRLVLAGPRQSRSAGGHPSSGDLVKLTRSSSGG